MHLKVTPQKISKIYPYPPIDQIYHYNKYAFSKKIYNNLTPPPHTHTYTHTHTHHTHTYTPHTYIHTTHIHTHTLTHHNIHIHIHIHTLMLILILECIYASVFRRSHPSPSIRSYLKNDKVITLLKLIVRDQG